MAAILEAIELDDLLVGDSRFDPIDQGDAASVGDSEVLDHLHVVIELLTLEVELVEVPEKSVSLEDLAFDRQNSVGRANFQLQFWLLRDHHENLN